MRCRVLKWMLPGLLMLAMLPSSTLAFDGAEDGRRFRQPPPEAYEACKGKEEGAKVTLKGPHGETMKGVCKEQGDRLVAVPADRPPAPRERQ
ncbi:hypothetical protein Pcar_0362 [Syntrophotalea carbinolica DSM 2380]|uniref:Uncharacterized protein n=1 Tax=Syntrophotalea carbinolica (strain DSM 2380 / NBRC 103641 / GraBd1) TaxID=338963 RepID=Q3A7M2_SYNC1|nr:hypothetical protein [Syntrophotalea carbinolica]ABA87622.1 hypothetical protein Pcar_0362 [Syntrophotalea carbinolica DSM 2380]